MKNLFARLINSCTFASLLKSNIPQAKRELSSAGSEHLPYKQGVTGSNPVVPTKENQTITIKSDCLIFFDTYKSKEKIVCFSNGISFLRRLFFKFFSQLGFLLAWRV